MSFKAVDVSNNNGNVNFAAIKNAGYKVVILRCTEGTSGRGSYDENYTKNFANAKAQGLIVGAYHFARFQNYAKCESEIPNFLNHVGNPDFYVLDQEQNLASGVDITDLSLYFMDKISSKKLTLFYSFASFLKEHCNAKITKYPLWIAHYGVNAPTVTYYDSYAMWQYTDRGSLPGISGNADLNYGTDAFLSKLTNGKYVAPPNSGITPEPTPVKASVGKSNISTIQSTLNARYGTKLSVDGIVGPATKSAIIKGIQIELKSQFGKNIVADGIYGPATKAALSGVIIKQGAQGNFTWLIQAQLAVRGWNISVDGIFGSDTTNKIKAFQKEKKLTVDGIVGPATIVALLTASL